MSSMARDYWDALAQEEDNGWEDVDRAKTASKQGLDTCRSYYVDSNICFTYSCDLTEGHAGAHQNNTDGPGMGWVD